MLSLIICSKHPTTSKVLLQNISQTIGCEYEIIHMDNSQGKYSIFQAYNEGVRLSKGENLCFMHEDLTFNSDNWGYKAEQYLKDDNLGLLGVAGVKVVPTHGDARMGGYFYGCNWDRYYTIEKNPRSAIDMKKIQPLGILKECAAVDGLWFCIPKRMFRQIKFDENTYQGFHLYDLDISMQVQMTGKIVMICDDIIIEHDSVGLFNQSFSDNLGIFSNKWKDVLPLQRGITLTGMQMKAFTEKSVTRLKKRIENDALKVNILNKYKLGGTSFTKSEQRLIKRSLQVYWRVRFQNSSASDSKNIYREFRKEEGNPFSLKINVWGKYLYYGLMRKNSRI